MGNPYDNRKTIRAKRIIRRCKDVVFTDGSVKFVDADEFIKYDLEDPSLRLSFFTINSWDIADYDETAQSFSFRQDEVEEAINNAVILQVDFSEV